MKSPHAMTTTQKQAAHTPDRLVEPWKSRREALCAEVARDRNYIWDAFDQGRLAFIEGVPVENNPHRLPTPGYFHANMTQWELGWRREREFAIADYGAAHVQ